LEDEDEGLKEFLSVMRPRKAAQSRTWGNDDIIEVNAKEGIMPVLQNDKDDDLYDDLPLKNNKDVDDELDEEIIVDNKMNDIAFDSNLSDMDYLRRKMQENKNNEKEEEKEKQAVKIHPGRLAILEEVGAVDQHKIINSYSQPEVAEVIEDKPEEIVAESNYVQEPSPDLIADTGRIMIRNLAYSCTYEDLEEHFKKFGPITEVLII